MAESLELLGELNGLLVGKEGLFEGTKAVVARFIESVLIRESS